MTFDNNLDLDSEMQLLAVTAQLEDLGFVIPESKIDEETDRLTILGVQALSILLDRAHADTSDAFAYLAESVCVDPACGDPHTVFNPQTLADTAVVLHAWVDAKVAAARVLEARRWNEAAGD